MNKEALEENTGDKAGHYYRFVTGAGIALGSDACAAVGGGEVRKQNQREEKVA